MNRNRRHVISKIGIDEIHVRRSGRCLWPLKTQSPLLVDADGKVAAAFTLERLEAVTLQGDHILERVGRPKSVEREPRRPLDARQCLDAFPGGECSGASAR